MIDLIATVAGLLGYSARDLIDTYLDRRKDQTEAARESVRAERLAALQRINRYALGRHLVQRLYRERLATSGLEFFSFALGDRQFQTGILAKPEWQDLRIPVSPDTERATLKQGNPPAFRPTPAEVVDIVTSTELLGLRLWDDPIFRLLSVDFGQEVASTSFSEDRFLRYRFTDGLVIDELTNALRTHSFDVDGVRMRWEELLPLRTRILPDGEAFLNFPARLCAGGITMLVALARPEGDYAFFVQKRSGTVHDSQGMLSVVPRAFHQGMVAPQMEVAPSFSAFREIYEELFGGEEAEQNVRRIRPDWFFVHPALQWFSRNPTDYSLRYTCFGLDAVSGNYQAGFLLAVKDPRYWEEFSHEMLHNWESESRGTSYLSSLDPVAIGELIQRPNWTGEGLYTLVQCLRALEEEDLSRVRLPDLRW
jgi:hypothetical protein